MRFTHFRSEGRRNNADEAPARRTGVIRYMPLIMGLGALAAFPADALAKKHRCVAALKKGSPKAIYEGKLAKGSTLRVKLPSMKKGHYFDFFFPKGYVTELVTAASKVPKEKRNAFTSGMIQKNLKSGLKALGKQSKVDYTCEPIKLPPAGKAKPQEKRKPPPSKSPKKRRRTMDL